VRGARLLGRRGLLLVQTRLPGHEVVEAAVRGTPMLVAEAERGRREALGFPPFGGLADVRGAAAAVAAACATAREQGVTVLGPTPDGTQALLRAPSTDALCDALAAPGVDAARNHGRLRVDVDPRRV
jgi:primosomal protein N' (replication factor Y) (superfamily II helicase)